MRAIRPSRRVRSNASVILLIYTPLLGSGSSSSSMRLRQSIGGSRQGDAERLRDGRHVFVAAPRKTREDNLRGVELPRDLGGLPDGVRRFEGRDDPLGLTE